MNATVRFSTTLGDCAISWSDVGVTGFSLPATPTLSLAPPAPSPALAPAPLPAGTPKDIITLIDRVRRHLRGDLQDFCDLDYAWETVTPFRQRVLRAVLAIAPGRTATYGEITAAIGAKPGTSRATGGAVGANPWPLLVPCHRILGAGGALTGYSAPGGLKTKAHLLALEGVELPSP
ncbi:MAG: MGMT family protein [Opitutaceae bacterium]|nr:MGMT family protein [Opitutaceae bacterium]